MATPSSTQAQEARIISNHTSCPREIRPLSRSQLGVANPSAFSAVVDTQAVEPRPASAHTHPRSASGTMVYTAWLERRKSTTRMAVCISSSSFGATPGKRASMSSSAGLQLRRRRETTLRGGTLIGRGKDRATLSAFCVRWGPFLPLFLLFFCFPFLFRSTCSKSGRKQAWPKCGLEVAT